MKIIFLTDLLKCLGMAFFSSMCRISPDCVMGRMPVYWLLLLQIMKKLLKTFIWRTINIYNIYKLSANDHVSLTFSILCDLKISKISKPRKSMYQGNDIKCREYLSAVNWAEMENLDVCESWNYFCRYILRYIVLRISFLFILKKENFAKLWRKLSVFRRD